jgi:hypothetical protein
MEVPGQCSIEPNVPYNVRLDCGMVRNYPSGIFGPVSKDLAWIASVIALRSGRGARSRVTGLRAARDFAVCMRDLADI